MSTMNVSLPKSLKDSLDATKVSYAQLGKSGLRLSVPIFGTMSFGHKDWQPWVEDNEEEVFALLKGAYDRGAYMDERRELAQIWADMLMEGKPAAAARDP